MHVNEETLPTKCVLLTGFRGTSSELLVKRAKCSSLVLPNDKLLDSRLLFKELDRKNYDYVLSFGQKPNMKDKVCIETVARGADYCGSTNDCAGKNCGSDMNYCAGTNNRDGTSYFGNTNLGVNTNFEYRSLKAAFESRKIPARISTNAGTSFCNALYWNGLNYIFAEGLRTKMLFVHIPFYKNLSDPECFLEEILAAVEAICGN